MLAVSFLGVRRRRPIPTENVFLVRNSAQVSRLYADSISTQVVYDHSLGNFPDEKLVNKSMGEDVFSKVKTCVSMAAEATGDAKAAV